MKDLLLLSGLFILFIIFFIFCIAAVKIIRRDKKEIHFYENQISMCLTTKDSGHCIGNCKNCVWGYKRF